MKDLALIELTCNGIWAKKLCTMKDYLGALHEIMRFLDACKNFIKICQKCVQEAT